MWSFLSDLTGFQTPEGNLYCRLAGPLVILFAAQSLLHSGPNQICKLNADRNRSPTLSTFCAHGIVQFSSSVSVFDFFCLPRRVNPHLSEQLLRCRCIDLEPAERGRT